MNWIMGVVLYFFLVWLFLRFFAFVSDADREIEEMERKVKLKNEKNGLA